MNRSFGRSLVLPAVFILFLAAAVFAQQTPPKEVPHFESMTADEVTTFQSDLDKIPGKGQSLFQFVDPNIGFRLECFRGRAGQGFDFWNGGYTRLTWGFRMRVDLHKADGSVETLYFKTVDNLRALTGQGKDTNLVVRLGRTGVKSFDLTILTVEKNKLYASQPVPSG